MDYCRLFVALYESKFNINNAPKTLTDAFNQYEYDRATKKFGRQSNQSNHSNHTSKSCNSNGNGNNDTSSSSSNHTDERAMLINTKSNGNVVTKSNNVVQLQQHQQQIQMNQKGQEGLNGSTSPQNKYQSTSNKVIQQLLNQQQQQQQQQQHNQNASYNTLSSSTNSSSGRISPHNINHYQTPLHNNQKPSTVTMSSNQGCAANTNTRTNMPSTCHNLSTSSSGGGISRFQNQQSPSSSTLLSSSSTYSSSKQPTHQQGKAQPSSSLHTNNNLYAKVTSMTNSRHTGTIPSNQNNIQSTNKTGGDGPLTKMSFNNLDRPATGRGDKSVINNGRNVLINPPTNSSFASTSATASSSLSIKGNENNKNLMNGKRIANTSLQQHVVKKANMYNGTNNPYATKKL